MNSVYSRHKLIAYTNFNMEQFAMRKFKYVIYKSLL